MKSEAIDRLHDVHTATNDVLKGYRELHARAQPDIQIVITRLLDMHRHHASEQRAELTRLHEASRGDASLQGALNQAVVIARSWVSDLDHEVLPAVREGEESLSQKYRNALEALTPYNDDAVTAMLQRQHAEITSEIEKLPSR